jgi:Subtilase family
MRQFKIILLLGCLISRVVFASTDTESSLLVWQTASNRVSADIRGEKLLPLLTDIAHKTSWHIFLEPGLDRKVDAKFSRLPSGEALKKLLGDLNFAFVPQTNEADQLYVFATTMRAATRRVAAAVTNTVAMQRHVANQLMVKLKPGANIDALAKLVGAKVVGRNDKLGIYLLEFSNAVSTDAALGQLKSNSDVQSVDYNYVYDPPPTPQPYSGTAPAPPKLIADVSNPGDPCNPVVALIDTAYQPSGTVLDQFALKPISVTGENCPRENGLTHATAMYQTILNAVSQASGGHSSVRILPVNVFGCDGTAISWNVALGMQAAATNGATVFNLSLGGTAESAVLHDVANQLLAQGVVIFAAAGNQPVDTKTFPAAFPGVNSVTALGASGQLAPYANYGSFSSLALPGTSIVYQGGQAWVVQGTSPATANATGVAVGIKTVNCAGWSEIETAMQQKFPVPQK